MTWNWTLIGTDDETRLYVQHEGRGVPYLVKSVGELAFCGGACMADYVSQAVVRHRDALEDDSCSALDGGKP